MELQLHPVSEAMPCDLHILIDICNILDQLSEQSTLSGGGVFFLCLNMSIVKNMAFCGREEAYVEINFHLCYIYLSRHNPRIILLKCRDFLSLMMNVLRICPWCTFWRKLLGQKHIFKTSYFRVFISFIYILNNSAAQMKILKQFEKRVPQMMFCQVGKQMFVSRVFIDFRARIQQLYT